MQASRKEIRNSLSRFVRQNCANFIDGECLGLDVFGKPFRNPGQCLVMIGKPCAYFRQCVLGSADTPYPHPCFARDPDYEKRVRVRYGRIDHKVVEIETARRCPDCNAALLKGHRYCVKCRSKRQRIAQRNKRQGKLAS